MLDDVVIKPMTEEFILWRCLHKGPHTEATLEQWPETGIDWPTHRAINVPLLRKLIRTYGTCAMLAWDGDRVVGFLRFYPAALCSVEEAAGMCLQQGHPAGPSEDTVNQCFPTLDQIEGKTLTVHCLMTGTPFLSENPYQRKGIGTRMVRALIDWAREKGWEAIEAAAYEDLDVIYAITGQAGKAFWLKLGFCLVGTRTEPEFQKENDFTRQMREQARAKGLDLEVIQNAYTMRLDLV